MSIVLGSQCNLWKNNKQYDGQDIQNYEKAAPLEDFLQPHFIRCYTFDNKAMKPHRGSYVCQFSHFLLR